MSLKQQLPTITSATIDSMIASTGDPDQIHEWIAKLCRENSQIVFILDGLNSEIKSSSLLIAAMVYKMLDSQMEADQMNKDFGPLGGSDE